MKEGQWWLLWSFPVSPPILCACSQQWMLTGAALRQSPTFSTAPATRRDARVNKGFDWSGGDEGRVAF